MINWYWVWMIIIGMLTGSFLTIYYLHYFSHYNLIKKGTYYLKEKSIFTCNKCLKKFEGSSSISKEKLE